VNFSPRNPPRRPPWNPLLARAARRPQRRLQAQSQSGRVVLARLLRHALDSGAMADQAYGSSLGRVSIVLAIVAFGAILSVRTLAIPIAGLGFCVAIGGLLGRGRAKQGLSVIGLVANAILAVAALMNR
jgi:hypothetical protein